MGDLACNLILLYRMCLQWLPNFREPVNRFLGWSLTLPLVMLGWIPFRAVSLEASLSMLARVLDISTYRSLAFRENFYLLVCVLTVGMLLAWFINEARYSLADKTCLMQLGETCVLSAILFAPFIFFRPINQFIYFQF